MPENQTLTFPTKSEWPTFTDTDWASNRRHAFLKFKRLLQSMFTSLDSFFPTISLPPAFASA